MKRKYVVAVCLLVVAGLAFFYYFTQRAPSGVESKGSSVLIKEIISLATAVVSLLTSIFTFLMARRKEEKQ